MSTNHLTESVSDYLDHSPDPEEEALELLIWLQDRFDWAGAMFTRRDVETIIERDLTDEEWAKVAATKPWRDAHSILLDGSDWAPVYMALDEAGIT